jgi:hypothetical protein
MSSHAPKRSTPINLEPVERTEKPLDELEYIRIAADMLQQLFSELRSLATSNPGLARALSSRGADARARLWTLHEIVDLLMGVDDLSMAVPLRRRATALISWLSNELDELTLRATTDDLPVDTLRVVLH